MTSNGVGARDNPGNLRPADEADNTQEIANCKGCASAGESDKGWKGSRDNDHQTGFDLTNGENELMSDGSSSNPATFHWKGQNYLEKMSHDLEFLTDGSSQSARQISTWLGFSAIRNPFLIPPEGHDVCETLRLEHEQLRESTASRRTQRRRESFARRRADSEAESRRYSRTTSLPQQAESNKNNASENGGDENVEVVSACTADTRGVIVAYGIGLGPAKTEASTESGSANLVSLAGDFGAVSCCSAERAENRLHHLHRRERVVDTAPLSFCSANIPALSIFHVRNGAS